MAISVVRDQVSMWTIEKTSQKFTMQENISDICARRSFKKQQPLQTSNFVSSKDHRVFTSIL